MVQTIFDAIKNNDVELARLMLNDDPSNAGARSENGVSAVLLATYYGRDEIVQFLLSAAPRLDIYEASAVGDLQTVRERAVVDPGLVNSFAPDGFTPLGLASFFGRETVVEWLLDAGAAPGLAARNGLGVAPLHSAVASRRGPIARRLVASGADVNARHAGGFTPLHGAAHNGDSELVEFLIASGADARARTDDGKTASDLAREQGHEQLAVALSNAEYSGN